MTDFAYTSFYAQWLQCLCAAVLLLTLLQWWWLEAEKEEPESDVAERTKTLFAVGFCLANCAFVQVFVRKWAVRERELASDWGVSDLKSSLQTRPQFRGEMERSPINLRLEPHYPPAKRSAKRLASCVVLLLLSGAILFGYYSLLAARVFESALRDSQLGFQGSNVLLAVVTKCVGVPLVHVSKRLNDWENYKMQADYDANLTLKCACCCLLPFLALTHSLTHRHACVRLCSRAAADRERLRGALVHDVPAPVPESRRV